MSLKNSPHLNILKCFVLPVQFCVVLLASISSSITITFDVLSTCMMVSWFLMPFCTLLLFFDLASSLDFQFFPPNINTIFIKNDCVYNIRWWCPVKQCLGSIQLHPLAQVVISNSLSDIFFNEVEELVSIIVGQERCSRFCPWLSQLHKDPSAVVEGWTPSNVFVLCKNNACK